MEWLEGEFQLSFLFQYVGRSALHYEFEKLEIIITLKLKYNTES